MKQDSYKIDDRTVQDIEEQIKNLAESYTPEWNFEKKNPDIGSVLALLFAQQHYGNIERFNQVLERYHTEFVNLLDISLRPAQPACATVLMELLTDTAPEVYVKKGTRLLAEDDDGVITFETAYPVILSPSKLNSSFMTLEEGKIIPIYGDFQKKNYIGNKEEKQNYPLVPFSLFNWKENGLECQAMVLYHSRIFDVENETIYCKIENSQFLDKLKNGEFRFLYYTDNQFIPVESCQIIGEKIVLVKKHPNQKVMLGNQQYSMIVIEAVKPQLEPLTFQSITFSSAGGVRNVEYVGNGSTDYEVTRFAMFGDTLSLFSECYIGMDHYFSKQGARITLEFQVDYQEHYIGFIKPKEEQNLKIIKRKPKISIENMVSYAYAEEISIEYHNGIGWKRLKCEKEYRGIFAEAKEGRISLSFISPNDWEAVQTGAYMGRVLRIQLQRSNNCYLQPCIHRYPIITHMTVAYTYEENYEKPEIGKVMFGTAEKNITNRLLENREFIGFERSNYADTALYLGFDKAFENGPISLWWKLKNIEHNGNHKLHIYYSSASGFKEMKVVDYTQGFSRTGVMLFLPPSDMGRCELEDRKLYWLKIVQEGGERKFVQIEDIRLNAVEVYNIVTHEPEEFYIDEVHAKMSFPLRTEDILDAEVWVNEKEELSEEVMRKMLEEQSDLVRANFNYLGKIEEFFVKWEERDNFNRSYQGDRHYVLDRMRNRILFGDGIHVKIPQNTNGVAFTVKLRCCDGRKGNVEANMINASDTNLMYVGNIYNPMPAYGGSNMETLERALFRGANLISSGGRFVTEQDYINEIQNFSENINKASIIVGTDRYGVSHEQMIYIVLLMKDFMDGSASFYQMQLELKKHLCKHCELTILPSELSIEEPVFVELSVDVWVQVMNIEDSFEIQNLMKETLDTYLNPITENKHKGWEIGVLPRKNQIMMRINAKKSKAMIKQIVVTAKYADNNGVHEMDLDAIKVTPFMVVKNGKHKIHITQAKNN